MNNPEAAHWRKIRQENGADEEWEKAYDKRSASSVAAPLAEKTGNEAAQTSEAVLALNSAGSTMAPGPDCQPLLVGGNTPEKIKRIMLEGESERLRVARAEAKIYSHEESERRGMGTITVQPIIYEDGKALTRLAPETGDYIVLEQAFKSVEAAVLALRALADALDGGQKRRHRKAKEE